MAPMKIVYHVLTRQRGRSVLFANQDSTLRCVLAPNSALKPEVFSHSSAVYHVLTSGIGKLDWFSNQDSTLVCVLAPRKVL